MAAQSAEISSLAEKQKQLVEAGAVVADAVEDSNSAGEAAAAAARASQDAANDALMQCSNLAAQLQELAGKLAAEEAILGEHERITHTNLSV